MQNHHQQNRNKNSSNANSKPFSGWKDQLQALINEHNPFRIDGGTASGDTQEERAKYLFKFMTDIRAMGYKVEPANVREKHIQAICSKFEADQLSASTIQTYISFLRAFCIWIKKPGMIKDVKQYFKNPKILERNYATTVDKSWEGNDVDKAKVFNEIKQERPSVWMQLLMCDAFGLRKKESICLRPFFDIKDGVVYVSRGAKNGRFRMIEFNIETEYQKEVVNQVMEYVGRTSKDLGRAGFKLEKNMKYFDNTMAKYGIKKTGKNALGITAHGLRAGFAIREMERRGLIPLIRGGKMGSLPKEEELRIRLEVSRLLGHNRIQVMVAYAGAFTIRGLDKITQERNKQLSNTLKGLQPGQVCDFACLEYETNDGQLVDATNIQRIFLGMIKINDAPYLEVERIEDGKRHKIAVGLLDEIIEIYESEEHVLEKYRGASPRRQPDLFDTQ